jgi:hypothetical protein
MSVPRVECQIAPEGKTVLDYQDTACVKTFVKTLPHDLYFLKRSIHARVFIVIRALGPLYAAVSQYQDWCLYRSFMTISMLVIIKPKAIQT